MSQRDFVHLHLCSQYSLRKGLTKLDTLIERCKHLGYNAVALTDYMNLFGMIQFHKAATRAGLKPIIGAELNVARQHQSGQVVALVQNQQGLLNLNHLLTGAYDGSFAYGQIDEEAFQSHGDGLILLAGPQSLFGQALLMGNRTQAERHLSELVKVWGNRLYLEVLNRRSEADEYYSNAALGLGQQFDIPVVASNAVCFLAQDDYHTHDARVCIAEGYKLDDANRPVVALPDQYLKSAEEMQELFADVEGVLENSVEIARRCTLVLPDDTVKFPDFPVEGSADEHLGKQSEQGLGVHLQSLDASEHAAYYQRLEYELGVIAKMGFASYFLIVAEFVGWAKQERIPVGPGRGSGVGSVAAWALGITSIDPLKHDLLFERFLNPERVSLPDFDIDFCMWNRDRVIDHVTNRYGADKVTQIVTFSTMQARGAIHDAARVQNKPRGMSEILADYIPNELNMTLESAYKDSSELQQAITSDPERREVWDLALKLEGVVRGTSKHAGGVVIAPQPMQIYAPLYKLDTDDSLVVQFDKDDAESIGLIKFDFLGLRNLTIIQLALDSINARLEQANKQPITLDDISEHDPDVYELLCRGQTLGIFQLESSGVTQLLQDMRPSVFEDLVAALALFRPGALGMNMHTRYVARKLEQEQVDYPHPLLEPVLRNTYGIIVYQEQVMQCAQVLSGFTLAQADELRRAMGKKDRKLMQTMGKVFLEGAVERGISRDQAERIYALLEQFSEYGFNKSHAVAYALISYQTAWLKSRYPADFFAAIMSCHTADSEQLQKLAQESARFSIRIHPPCVNNSQVLFSVQSDNEVAYGLQALKGVGKGVASCLVQEREQNGPFKSLYDLCSRIGMQSVSLNALTILIAAGAMDCFAGWSRRAMSESLLTIAQAIQQGDSANSDMFGGVDESNINLDAYVNMQEWSSTERLQEQWQALGFFLGEHPLNAYQHYLNRHEFASFSSNFVDLAGGRIRLAGVLVNIKRRRFRRDDGKMHTVQIISLDDGQRLVQVQADDPEVQAITAQLPKGSLVGMNVTVQVRRKSENYSLRVENIRSLDEYLASLVGQVQLFVPEQASEALLKQLDHGADGNIATIPVVLVYSSEESPNAYLAAPNLRLSLPELQALEQNIDGVRVVYD